MSRFYAILPAGWVLALLPCLIAATSSPRRVSLPWSRAEARQVYQVKATLGGTVNFVSPDTNADPEVGRGPWSIAVGDLDKDGDLDLLTANYWASTVSVLLNDGQGSFSNINPDLTVGNKPYSVAVGDVDGDGDLDLLTANKGSNTVSVRFNDGQGSFSGGTDPDPNVGSWPESVAVGDVDGDKDLDLVTANTGDNKVSVRLNDGQGNFSVPATNANPAVGGLVPVSLAVGDVDGDKDLDLVTANYSNSTVSVLLNDSTGSFTSSTVLDVGQFPYSVAVGDLNNDGKLDLITANQEGNSMSVLLNDQGNFTRGTDISVAGRPQSVAVGDVNGDGFLDLLTANTNTSTVSVRLNDQKGSFTPPGINPDPAVGVPASRNKPYGVAVGDVDGDGDLDLLTANEEAQYVNGTVSVRLNQSDAPLPVELVRFTVRAQNPAAVRLAWTTASELHSAAFVVERSRDGTSFLPLGQVAAAGTSATPHDYAFTDTSLPAGVNPLYYRLHQVDWEGAARYSPVRSVALAGIASTLFPNPTHGGATLLGAAAGTPVVVLDALGRPVLHTTADATGTAHLVLPLGLASGVYVVRAGPQVLRLALD